MTAAMTRFRSMKSSESRSKKAGCQDSGSLEKSILAPSWSVGFSSYLAIELALSFAFLAFGRKEFSPGLRGRLTPVMRRF